MTVWIKRPCAWAGCHCYAVEGKSYCEKHLEAKKAEKRARDRARGTRTQRGYTNAWLRVAKAFLDEHPFCAECLRHGKHTPATEVDHIVPHKGDRRLFWDAKNWQALCHECHSRKTFMEDGAFNRPLNPRGDRKSRPQRSEPTR